jgi:hypothetical protein
MAKSACNFDAVRKIGLALAGVQESTAWGVPALKVRGEMMACVPTHCVAEPGSLVVRVDFPDRDELIARAPDIYYVTEHYVGYTAVLVRMARIDPGVLRDLLGMAHKFVSKKAAARGTSRKSGKRKARKEIGVGRRGDQFRDGAGERRCDDGVCHQPTGGDGQRHRA